MSQEIIKCPCCGAVLRVIKVTPDSACESEYVTVSEVPK